MSEIKLENLDKKFGQLDVLSGFSEVIEAEELVCIQGATGCGKSTLLRIIAGLERPDSGRVTIDGMIVASGDEWVAPALRGVSMVFQERALWPHLSVSKHLDIVLGGTGLSRTERRERVARECARCKLLGLEKKRVADLSGGQQQQVAIARALVVDTPVLLLDEPFNHLDSSLREHFMEVFRAEYERGRTIIFTTHRDEEAQALATRIARMGD